MTAPEGETAGRAWTHREIARRYRILASKCNSRDDASDLREYADMHIRAALSRATATGEVK